MGLLSRALQGAGLEATSITWRDAIARLVQPGRVVLTQLPRGATLGTPGDAAQQRRLLEATLDRLRVPPSAAPLVLRETLTRAFD